MLLAALAYFVVPSDMIPDFIAGLGFTDDATVLFATVRMVAGHISDRHHEQARRRLIALGLRQDTAPVGCATGTLRKRRPRRPVACWEGRRLRRPTPGARTNDG